MHKTSLHSWAGSFLSQPLHCRTDVLEDERSEKSLWLGRTRWNFVAANNQFGTVRLCCAGAGVRADHICATGSLHHAYSLNQCTTKGSALKGRRDIVGRIIRRNEKSGFGRTKQRRIEGAMQEVGSVLNIFVPLGGHHHSHSMHRTKVFMDF